jgi:hypothetical protein
MISEISRYLMQRAIGEELNVYQYEGGYAKALIDGGISPTTEKAYCGYFASEDPSISNDARI